MKDFSGRFESSDITKNLHDALIDLYSSNILSFHIRRNNNHTEESKGYEVWGIYHEPKDVVFFYKNILKREMSKMGYSWGTLKMLKKAGMLHIDRKDYLTSQIMVNGKRLGLIAVELNSKEREEEL